MAEHKESVERRQLAAEINTMKEEIGLEVPPIPHPDGDVNAADDVHVESIASEHDYPITPGGAEMTSRTVSPGVVQDTSLCEAMQSMEQQRRSDEISPPCTM